MGKNTAELKWRKKYEICRIGNRCSICTDNECIPSYGICFSSRAWQRANCAPQTKSEQQEIKEQKHTDGVHPLFHVSNGKLVANSIYTHLLLLKVKEEKHMTQKYNNAKLCVPSSMEDELIDGLDKINDHCDGLKVHEIYCALQQTPFGGGRPSKLLTYVGKKEFSAHVKYAHDRGIQVNYLLNPMCCGGKEYDPQTHRAMMEHIEWAYSIGVDSVTIAIPFFMDTVRERFPDLKICASVNAEINSPQRAQMVETLGADRIIFDNFLNRKFDNIRAIKRSVNCSIEALVNEPCLLNCAFRLYHQMLFGHGSQTGANGLPPVIPDYAQIKCSMKRLLDPSEIIKAPWYRPEDIKHLSQAGVDYIKLSGRGQPTDWILKCANAYSMQQYEGNIYELVEKQGLCSSEYEILLGEKETLNPFRFAVDNRALDGFIEPFVEGKMHCEFGCDGCTYCKGFAKRAVTYNHELANQHNKRLNSTLKSLTTGEFTSEKTYMKLKAQLANVVVAEA